jgi:hypothetical protein
MQVFRESAFADMLGRTLGATRTRSSAPCADARREMQREGHPRQTTYARDVCPGSAKSNTLFAVKMSLLGRINSRYLLRRKFLGNSSRQGRLTRRCRCRRASPCRSPIRAATFPASGAALPDAAMMLRAKRASASAAIIIAASPSLFVAECSRRVGYGVMPSSFAAVPPSIASRSASLNPGVARM